MVKEGWNAPEKLKQSVSELGYWGEHLFKNVIDPFHIRPSSRRVCEVWSKIAKRRQDIWKGPNCDPSAQIREYLSKVRENVLFPDCWCLKGCITSIEAFKYSFGDEPFPFARDDPERAKMHLLLGDKLVIRWPYQDADAQQTFLKYLKIPAEACIDTNLLRWCIVSGCQYGRVWTQLAGTDRSLFIPEDFPDVQRIIPGSGKYIFQDPWSKWLVALDEVKPHNPVYADVLSTLAGIPITKGEALEVGPYESPVYDKTGEISRHTPVGQLSQAVYDVLDAVAQGLREQVRDREESVPESAYIPLIEESYPDLEDALEDSACCLLWDEDPG